MQARRHSGAFRVVEKPSSWYLSCAGSSFSLYQYVGVDRHLGIDVQRGQTLGVDVVPAGDPAIGPAGARIEAIAGIAVDSQGIGIGHREHVSRGQGERVGARKPKVTFN